MKWIKRFLGLAIIAAVIYYVLKNVRQVRPDPSEEKQKEVDALQKIGNLKRDAALNAEVPISTLGETPYSGIPLTALVAPQLRKSKGTRLLPKGAHKNPFDRVLNN
jgi:hypothetical protein